MKTTVTSELLDKHAENFAYQVYAEEKAMKPTQLLLYLHILRKIKKHKWRHQVDYDLHSEMSWKALHISHNTYRQARKALIDYDLIKIVSLGGRHGDVKVATSISIVTDRLLNYVLAKPQLPNSGSWENPTLDSGSKT